jgi:amidase
MRPSARLVAIIVATFVCGAVTSCDRGGPPTPPVTFKLEEATIADIRVALDSGALTCRHLATLYAERIAAYEDDGPKLNAITTINPKLMEEAAALDTRRRGSAAPLHCIPILLKDNIDAVGMPTSNGSVILKDAMPPQDAGIVKRLRAAGALILGKSAMGEFAGGSYNTIDGQAVNPYSFKRNTGGSSSGSGASVAANLTVLAIGTDTSTSVRGPASFNGIVGLRPTTGLISRDGIAPKNLLFDTAGPMSRTVADVAMLLNVVAGSDPADALSVDVHGKHPMADTASGYRDFTTFLRPGALRDTRLGVLRDFFGGDPEVDGLANAALAKMRELGAQTVDIYLDPAFIDFYVRRGGANIRTPADRRFRQDWETYLLRFGPAVPKTVAEFVKIYQTDVARSALPVEDSVMNLLTRSLTTSTSDPEYLRLVNDVLPAATSLKLAIFEANHVDALVFPYNAGFAAPISNPAKKIADSSFVEASTPSPAILAGYSSVGFPGIVVPMGFGSHGLPMDISFMGRPYDEGKLLGYAFDYEQATKLRRPSRLVPPLATDIVTATPLHAPGGGHPF